MFIQKANNNNDGDLRSYKSCENDCNIAFIDLFPIV